jgi:hypothetical protein
MFTTVFMAQPGGGTTFTFPRVECSTVLVASLL